jgi:L-erythro-3,5-diaminohexanoate dehydrogenase
MLPADGGSERERFLRDDPYDELTGSGCTASSSPPARCRRPPPASTPRTELWPDEVRVRVERLNLDAASFRQLATKHGGDGAAVRREVVDIVRRRGKMQNPVTGSGGMLVGVVDEVGPESPLGLRVGDRIATLVSLSLTPLQIDDDLARWDGRSEQVPADGHAILFGRSIAAVLPDDLPGALAMAVLDVCGAPALTARVVAAMSSAGGPRSSPSWAVPGRAGPCHSSRPVARAPGVRSPSSRSSGRAAQLAPTGIADRIALADARDPVALGGAVARELGAPADVTVVCVDVPGCEHGSILGDRRRGDRHLLLDGHLVLGRRPGGPRVSPPT